MHQALTMSEHILISDPRIHQTSSRIISADCRLLATELCALGGVGCILLIFDKRSLPQYKNFGKRWRVQTLAKMGFCATYVPCQEGSAIDFWSAREYSMRNNEERVEPRYLTFEWARIFWIRKAFVVPFLTRAFLLLRLAGFIRYTWADFHSDCRITITFRVRKSERSYFQVMKNDEAKEHSSA